MSEEPNNREESPLLRKLLTEEKQAEIWENLRAQVASEPARKSSSVWIWSSALATLIVIAFALSTLTVGRFRYVTEVRSEGTLPKNLQFNFLTHKLRLFGEAPPLDGRLSRTNSSAGLTVFSGILKGRDKDGIEAVFHGELIMTNAPGIQRARKMNQVLGARVEGSLIISGKTNFVTGRYDKAN